MLSRLEKRWELFPRLPLAVDAALSAYPFPVRQLLYNRGIETHEQAVAFLSGEVPLHTPWLLSDMGDAVERLLWGIDHDERIIIYGDYDVDGVTASALLYEVLQFLGANDVQVYIPSRFDEGYGLNFAAIKELANNGANLIVTVDCGIRSIDEVAYANRHGLDVIVTDHHHPKSELPPARVVVSPKRSADPYPEKNLAGVGLVYKLVQALLERRPVPGIDPANWLDLVALGTVADMVPLVGENRVLVRRGIVQMRQAKRKGLVALARTAGYDLTRVNAEAIGFILGPRLNASGRLETAIDAYQLLVAQQPEVCMNLAQVLDNRNRERQRLTLEMQRRAEEMILDPHSRTLLVVFEENFNEGVVGLVASRLVEAYYRPAVVGVRGEVFSKASCRSIPEFHITEALDQCADLLDRHGGHALAAGFTVRTERLSQLIGRLEEVADQTLRERELLPVLRADLEISLSEMRPDLLGYLQQFEPFGLGNPEATFISRGVEVRSARQVGAEGRHLSLKLSDGRFIYDAIAFGQGNRLDEVTPWIDIVYSLGVNRYNGQETLQLTLRDFRPSA
ncbi:single-stranded-DNA-specific exonuclease RecJ [uncultured Thermanaerothrix sp.]|uniref:single-stranded-DNA-specific exonuclease RecJ n=1 Tax=uncultured Thermanaerothrix sp. TaxID=1195149 RepID=UPI0026280141|nr:single-stranded-DNA-specific exonuclease RecJ [uncultured Thermanaerothrix sp.]